MPKPPRVCFDRVLQKNIFQFQRTARARRGGPVRAITPIGKLWMNGSTLRVKFIGGNATERSTAKEQANWWTAHVNLKFEFDNSPGAEIRISFDANDGAWSYVGTDAKGIPANQATMNLGFLDGGTAGHEFGHAIGLAHEHQNPSGGIQWNEPVVIQALAGSPNFWDERTTRHNVLNKYTANQINGTDFDPESIMLYFFPAEWTLNGIGTKQNEVLSALDKQFAAGAKMYPKTEPGVTGDVPLLKVNAPKRTQATIGKPGEEDLFRFVVEAGGRYLVDTKGPTDVVMKLFGPNSNTNLIAEDDDSGMATNARIAVDAIPGEYFVQIRHWNLQRGTGAYSIAVKEA
jgi:hypothetical protein